VVAPEALLPAVRRALGVLAALVPQVPARACAEARAVVATRAARHAARAEWPVVRQGEQQAAAVAQQGAVVAVPQPEVGAAAVLRALAAAERRQEAARAASAEPLLPFSSRAQRLAPAKSSIELRSRMYSSPHCRRRLHLPVEQLRRLRELCRP
jgi:hypothetical protein